MNSFVPGCHCPVKNLDVGQQYEFRVMAENQFGASEPLETKEPITAKHPFGKCIGIHSPQTPDNGHTTGQKVRLCGWDLAGSLVDN